MGAPQTVHGARGLQASWQFCVVVKVQLSGLLGSGVHVIVSVQPSTFELQVLVVVVDLSDELVLDLKVIPPRTVREELFLLATVVLLESVTVYVLSPEAPRLIAIDSVKPMDLRMLEVAVVLNSVGSPLG